MTKGTITIETGWNLDNSYGRLPELFFFRLKPTPVASPKLVILNNPLAESLGLSAEALQSNESVAMLAGNRIPPGSKPLAQAYAGHQFGHFTMLGDGRALLLGEQLTPSGERFDIQLKGSGRTTYSRGGDGRAALGPMLREYIISEAMHALGIPTTRSLAVVTTGEPVFREEELPGAVLTRVAASHLRVGTFEYAAQWGTVEDLRTLADYTIRRHFPKVENDNNRYLSLLREVIKAQALLIAKWQLVGFIHGVMNTDNMTLSGDTIDYGPCAFMDYYDPKTVFSSIDLHGRYAYGNQPKIAAWNLARFAETLLPLLDKNQDRAVELAQDEISHFSELYHFNWSMGMKGKLGIFGREPQDEVLVEDLLNIMQKYKADFANTFRALTLGQPEDTVLFGRQEFTKWHELWQARLVRQREKQASSQELMERSNPAVIPRNHLVEEALGSALQGDYSVMDRLLKVLLKPFDYSSRQAKYIEPPSPTACPYKTFCGT
ncbi:MAG: protein adenylyltransferase SelO [Bacillota bacterium]